MKTIRGLVVCCAFLSWAWPSDAFCANSRRIASTGFGGISYVFTPGVCDGGYPCPGDGTSVTDDASGDFWLLGFGDPFEGAGIDSGAWPALEGSYQLDGWLYIYHPYEAVLYGNWAGDLRVDGCPDSVAPPGSPGLCTAIQLSDQLDGVGYFALLSAASNAAGEYDYEQAGNADITLAEIQRPVIVGMTGPPTNPTVTVAPPVIDSGLYLDPSCDDPLAAYRLYSIEVPAGAAPPVDRRIEAGWVDRTGDVALGEAVEVTFSCSSDVTSYLATRLIFDSGFATDVLSRNSLRVECGPNFTEIDARPRVRPGATLDLSGRTRKRESGR